MLPPVINWVLYMKYHKERIKEILCKLSIELYILKQNKDSRFISFVLFTNEKNA